MYFEEIFLKLPYSIRSKLMSISVLVHFFLNVAIALILLFAVYGVKKYNLVFYESIDDFNNIIALTISTLGIYGVFFAFLQFLFGSKMENNLFWGINKIQFAILGKFVYKLINLFITKLVIICFIIVPIIGFLIDKLIVLESVDIFLYFISFWTVSFIYLIIIFGFLLIESITSLFLFFEIENDWDWKVEHKIRKRILKEALFYIKKDYFWTYFDDLKKNISVNEHFAFTKYIFNNMLRNIFENIRKSKKNINSCDERIQVNKFFEERWKHVKELSIKEKLDLLKDEIDCINDYLEILLDKINFGEYLSRNNDLLEPFHDIISEIDSAENIHLFLNNMNSCKYFYFKDENEIQEIIHKLLIVMKNNYSIRNNEKIEEYLKKFTQRSTYSTLMYAAFHNVIDQYKTGEIEDKKFFIKFILNTLDKNYVYNFIFYQILHTGSGSEIQLQNEVLFFKELYDRHTGRETINSEKLCDFIGKSNIGHRIDSTLINWLVDNLEKELNNDIISQICNRRYIDYKIFLKIKFIFSKNFKYQFHDFTYFQELDLKKLSDDNIRDLIESYCEYISFNLPLLDDYFMQKHHEQFIKKFDDYFIDFIDQILKQTNFERKHIILYLLKDASKVKKYIVEKKIIIFEDKYSYIDDYFIKFILLVFFDINFSKIFKENDAIKSKIKKKLEQSECDGELNNYLEELIYPINECNYLYKTKNLKMKILKYFNINLR